MKAILFWIIGIIFTAGIFNCNPNGINSSDQSGAEAEHGHDHEEHHDHTHGEEEHGHDGEADLEEEIVEFTHIQAEKIGLKLGHIVTKQLDGTIKVNGLLELPPDQKATISTPMGGILKEVRVHLGDNIKKGSTVAIIQNLELTNMQEEYLKAVAEHEFQQSEFKRLETLVETEVAAKNQLLATHAAVRKSNATIQAMKTKFKLLGVPIPEFDKELPSTFAIKSPINGYVQDISAFLGGYIQPEQTIVEVVRTEHLHAELKVFETEMDYVRIGQIINLTLQSKPMELIPGAVFSINKEVDEETKAIILHVEVDNPKGNLLPGMYVEGRLIIEENVLVALPNQAIASDKELDYVFLKTGEDEEHVTFKKIQVIIGASDRGFTAITPLSPIRPEDAIVVDGAFFLMAQSKIGDAGAGGHHHH